MANGVVTSPTYLGNIRDFFTPDDIRHMGAKGIDLSTYDGVKRNALAVYAHTGPKGDMPPPPNPKWTDDQHQTFKNWIMTGYPMGTATEPATTPAVTPATPGARIRKNVETLTTDEVATLKAAFTGLMQREPSDPNS